MFQLLVDPAFSPRRSAPLISEDMTMPLKGIIFDLDGVLVDTVPMHFRAWRRMLTDYGYSFDFSDYRDLVDGRPRFDGARAVMVNHTDAEVREAAGRKNDYYREMIGRGEFVVFEAAARLVNECRVRGYALATASSSVNVDELLVKAGIREAFSAVIGGDDIVRGKPAPDIFLAAARELDLQPGDCAVIEDSVFGVQAAKAGGFRCVRLAPEGNIGIQPDADLVLHSLDELRIDRVEALFLG
jgi:beta-phosphoglucomutase